MIEVVGAGPVGCRVAELLALGGEKVKIYEEHRKTGIPSHCAGIVSPRLSKITKTDAVINQVKYAHFFGEKVDFTLKGRADVIDRVKFDQQLSERAEAAGARLIFGKRIKLSQLTADRIVACDGARSGIRSHFLEYPGLLPSSQYIIQHQIDPDTAEIHFWPLYSTPGLFLWVVPLTSHLSRIGVACMQPKRVLDSFIKKRFPKGKIVEKMAGTVVIGGPAKANWGRVLLCGDAAGQVKATTGGGLVPGTICAEACANHILKGIPYEPSCASLLRQLKLMSWARKIWNQLPPNNKEELVGIMPRNRKFLETADMDFQRKLIIGLSLREFPTITKAFLSLLASLRP